MMIDCASPEICTHPFSQRDSPPDRDIAITNMYFYTYKRFRENRGTIFYFCSTASKT